MGWRWGRKKMGEMRVKGDNDGVEKNLFFKKEKMGSLEVVLKRSNGVLG